MKFFSKYQKYYAKMENFFSILEHFNEIYISKKEQKKLLRNYLPIYRYFKNIGNSDKIRKFLKIYSNLEAYFQTHNSIYLKNQLLEYEDLLNNIDGKQLDYQQKMAVLTDDKNNLIIAGAGSGKTLTISGKVKYLIESKKAKPDEILLISFTDKAVKEMSERLKRLDIEVQAKTFHKLGLEIITAFRKSRPNIATGDFLDQIISDYFKKEILNFPEQIKNILEFMCAYLYIPEDIASFDNLGDYIDHFRNIDYETVESKYLQAIGQIKEPQKVRRLDDLIIANFLFFHKINYKYDYPYPYEAKNSFKRKFKSNFYLPDNDLHLEHFLIDENGHSKFLTEYEEQKYLAEIEVKRTLHAEHQTKLIETYSYYNKNNCLLENLSNSLIQNNVPLKTANLNEIFKKIYIFKKDKQFEEFIKLIKSFLSLFKSNNFQFADIQNLLVDNNKLQNSFLKNRNKLFLSIFRNFFEFYENALFSTNQIDFNDMINKSTEIIQLGFLPQTYKYIVIDEFQDISMSRFKLIRALQNKTGAKIICVGDDWQSIYRFSGSDIDLFSNFEKYFGPAKFLKIEKTYRNSQQLIDIASNFVTQNPNQLKKDLKSDKHIAHPIKVFTYCENIIEAVEKCINDIISEFGENAEVLLLGRTRYDLYELENSDKFEIQDDLNIQYKQIPSLKISFLTIHKSKGLEADNVILLNMQNSMLGFPNRISSDPILSLVLANKEEHLYAEERRLFYVAITRTKNRTYLVAPQIHYSCFLEELIANKNVHNPENEKKIDTQNLPKCPKCKKGYLILRKNNATDAEFLGCNNYPHCEFTIHDINILHKQIHCKKCGGYLVEKNTKNGIIYACSNYPFCKNILKD